MESVFKLVLATAGASSVITALSSMQSALGGLQVALGGIISTAGATTASISGVRDALKFGKELQQLSLRTGDSVRDLVELQQAFKLSGLEADQVGPMVNRLQKAIAGLNDEGKSTSPAFEKLGVSAGSMGKLLPLQQFQLLSAAFAKIPDPAQRAALAMALFGKNGGQMLQLFRDPEAFAMAEEQSGRLGQRMEENAESFADLEKRLTAVNTRMKEMWVTLAESLVPSLGKMADAAKNINLAPIGAGLSDLLATVLPSAAVYGFAKFNAVAQKEAAATAAQAAAHTLAELDRRLGAAGTGGAGLSGSIMGGLAPVTGFLAKILPMGLSAVVGYEVGKGIGDGINEALAQAGKDALRRGTENLAPIAQRANDIRTEDDRKGVVTAAIGEMDALYKLIGETSDPAALESYTRQLFLIKKIIDDMTSDYAEQLEAQNKQKDVAAEQVQAEQAAEKWLQSEHAKTLAQRLIDKATEGETLDQQITGLQGSVALVKDLLANFQATHGVLGQEASDQKELMELLERQDELTKALAAKEKQRAEVAKAATAAAREQAKLALDDLENQKEAIAYYLEINRAKIEGDYSKTDAEKWGPLQENLEQQIAAKQSYIDDLEKKRAATNDPKTQEMYDSKILSGQGDLDRLRVQWLQIGPDPNSYAQQIIAATTAAQNSIGTLAQQSAKLWTDTGESIRTSMGTAINQLIFTTGSARAKLATFFGSIGQSLATNASQMAADWIYSHVIMANAKKLFEVQATADAAAGADARAVLREGETAHDAAMTGVQVGTHAAGETAKTGSTLMGSLARRIIALGETIWHGIQVAVRTAAHLAGETLQTGITIINSGERIVCDAAETAANIVKAAAGAMSAMASIPWVGPVLAIAAMGAIIAAGASLMKGFAVGGFTDPGSRDRPAGIVHAGEWIAPKWMVDNARYQPMIASLEAARQGQPGSPSQQYAAAVGGGSGWNPVGTPWQPDAGQSYLSPAAGQTAYAKPAVPAMAGGGTSSGAGGSSEPHIHVGIFGPDMQSVFQQWAESRQGRKYLINMANGTVQRA
jgi:hypothetical protein